jgi:hypothetical protein
MRKTVLNREMSLSLRHRKSSDPLPLGLQVIPNLLPRPPLRNPQRIIADYCK